MAPTTALPPLPPPLPAHLGSPSHCQRRSLAITPTLRRQGDPPYVTRSAAPHEEQPNPKTISKEGACAVVDLASESALLPSPTSSGRGQTGVTCCVRRQGNVAGRESDIVKKMVNVLKGILIECDPAMKQFLLYLDESNALGKKFIIQDLDETHVFVLAEMVNFLQERVGELMDQNSFPITQK
ncbi:putative General transcription factor IIH subunit 5 protein [Naja naja]|nr:putative General transcription factor IIH subunit 5 protein [Naja naja]